LGGGNRTTIAVRSTAVNGPSRHERDGRHQLSSTLMQ
jgi:hypothetical protein